MKVVAKIYSCNYETYKLIYKDAVKRALKKDKIKFNEKKIELEKINLPGNSIKAQRSAVNHSRTITVEVNGKPKYIIGISNTGFDEDRKKESDSGGKKYEYGESDYHSNSYLCQGINKIFELYYDTKKNYPDVKLYFYLLDVGKKSYPDNLSNNLVYRQLYTLGFEILNIEYIKFSDFAQLGFDLQESGNHYEYVSFNKFTNDILYISKRNKANAPAYLKCIDYDYDISKETNYKEYEYDEFKSHDNKEYIYTFKTLGAQSYDNFLVMWTLNYLAEKENKKLKFVFSKEKFNFRLDQPPEDIKFTEDFPDTITRLFEKIGIDIKYESTDEIRQQFNREIKQYETAKSKGTIRNQELFKNNLRKKGLETKCYICGCEVEEILEAAHLWGVADINKCSSSEIKSILSIECMKDLIDSHSNHSKELFYKKYVLANCGDNGVWLCRNHHGLFDRNFYCFDSENGKILMRINSNESFEVYMKLSKYTSLSKDVLTDKTKNFLCQRKSIFEKKVGAYK